MIIVNCNNEKNSNHPNHSLAEWDGGCLKESLTLRRGIFLETRGAPQAPDCRGRDQEETNFAPWAVIGGPGLAAMQGGPSTGAINRKVFHLGSGARNLPQPRLSLTEVTNRGSLMGAPRRAALPHLGADF